MSSFSVRNGTARGSESLCDSCYWAHIQKGFAESEEVVLCAFLRPARPVPSKVRHCTDYSDKRVPSKQDYGGHRLDHSDEGSESAGWVLNG
jgi:hypothetical protein